MSPSLSTTGVRPPNTGRLTVNLYDGTRQLVGEGAQLQFTVIDGNHKTLIDKQIFPGPTRIFDLPFYNNYGDRYTVVVWTKGYIQAGYTPVTISPNTDQHLDLILFPENGHFNFSKALWSDLQGSYPKIAALLAASDPTPAATQARYDQLREDDAKQPSLASFFNLATAMSAINLPPLGALRTPLDYIKRIVWDDPKHAFAQDRFFGWADARLIGQVKVAALQHQFVAEIDPWIFHTSATSSWKQKQFGEANVQLTFHEGEVQQIDGVDCVMVEPDIDYYKDPGAHFLLEVVRNAVSQALTDPKIVYQLRWIASRHAGAPDFDPPYTVAA